MNISSTDVSNTFTSEELNAKAFFDLSDFEHSELFKQSENYVWDALKKINLYLDDWFVKYRPSNIGKQKWSEAYFTNEDEISIGEGTTIEPGAYIKGPCVIGRNCEIRQGAYIRGQVITGNHVVIGHATEVKNAILLNNAHAAHFAYIGDSILGNHTNLGAGTRLANMPLFSTKNPLTGKRPSITIQIGNKRYDTGLSKLGGIIGDESQTGCNSVLNPGCIIGRHAFIYAGTVLQKGYVPANQVVKLRQSTENKDYILRAQDVIFDWLKENINKSSIQRSSIDFESLPGGKNILASEYCDELSLPQGSTYAEAVSALVS